MKFEQQLRAYWF